MNKTATTKEVKKYIKKLRQHLLLSHSKQETKQIIGLLTQNIDTFFEENPSASFQDFEKDFGSIDEIASSVFEIGLSQNSSQKLNTLHFHGRFFTFLKVSVLLLVLLIGSLYIKSYFDAHDQMITHEKTVIIEEAPEDSTKK